MATKILAMLLTALIVFWLVCVGVFLFALQFGFEWSFLLCIDVFILLLALRWIVSGAKNDKG